MNEAVIVDETSMFRVWVSLSIEMVETLLVLAVGDARGEAGDNA